MAIRVADITLSLVIESSAPSGRGPHQSRKHAREAIEYAVLSHYDAKRLPSGEYALGVPYSTDTHLDERVAELLRSIAEEAAEHDCRSASGARLAGSNRAWDE